MTVKQLRAALKRHAMTQAQLAKKLKVTDRTARRWCSGESPVPAEVTLFFRDLDKANEADFYERFGGGPRTIVRKR
jgi:transcriptional regulator with XRE-family HTH domain